MEILIEWVVSKEAKLEFLEDLEQEGKRGFKPKTFCGR